jgi:DnaJ domain
VKDYYSILRVSRSADVQTIKRAYRRLVQQYHPDINPDPKAADLTKEINEAYDVLSDPVKKSEYDFRLINPYQQQSPQPQQPAPRQHRDPYFRRRGFRPIYKAPTEYDLIVRYFHYVRKVCITGLVVCFILLLDYSLPHRQTRVECKIDYGVGRDYILTPYKSIPVMREELRPFEESEDVVLIESRLLGKTIEIRSMDGEHSITTFGTVYGTFKFVPILVFITALICLFMRDNLEFRFGLCVLTGFALFFTLVLMYV